MRTKYTIGYSETFSEYFIIQNCPILCSHCQRELQEHEEVIIKINDNRSDFYFCTACVNANDIIKQYIIICSATVTNHPPRKFIPVLNLDPVLSDGKFSVWETQKLEGHIIDKTIYANSTPSLEGAKIGAEIDDRWRDKEIKSTKKVDDFFADRGKPIKQIKGEKNENSQIALG
jgi:hypothetical protein